MDSTQMALFRALNRHFFRAPLSQCTPTVPLHRRLNCVAHKSNCFASSPLLRSLSAVVTRLPCRSQCLSSSAAPFASSGAENGGFGGESGGGGAGGGGGPGNGGAGGDSGDANPKLVGEGAKELLALSPDVIILDVGGMVCGGCAANVKRILESRPQVASASVNLATETAIVWPVSEAKTIPNWQKQLGEALAEHLTSCGFKSSLRVAG